MTKWNRYHRLNHFHTGKILNQRSDAPSADKAVSQYRIHASGYDASAKRTMRLRLKTIEHLALKSGDRVLDVASGTGLSFPLLRDAVGATGEVIGVDVSPEMTKIAEQRVVTAGWKNVKVLQSSLESAQIDGPLDAVLFNFTHDIMRSPTALECIFSATAPGTRIAFAGMKYVPWWMAPANIIVRAKARPYMTTFEGLEKPWDLALPYLSTFEWRSVLFGIGYIGWGVVRDR